MLDGLAEECADVEGNDGFEDWFSEVGEWDGTEEHNRRIYDLCWSQANQLHEFLGDEAYECLLWGIRR